MILASHYNVVSCPLGIVRCLIYDIDTAQFYIDIHLYFQDSFSIPSYLFKLQQLIWLPTSVYNHLVAKSHLFLNMAWVW